MFKKVKKRNNKVVKFDAEKIVKAVQRAGQATGEFDERTARQLTVRVLNLAYQTLQHKIPTVEEIQDIVEEVLLASRYKKTAKAYIIYRDQHAKIREITNKSEIGLIDDYLKELDWRVKENSNMAFSLQGLNHYVASKLSKVYWLNKIYPPDIRRAHESGDFHIHDLDILSVYCVGWDLYDLLKQGFRGVAGKIESKPAKHLRTSLGQVVNFFYTLQGESAGAQAFSNFDTLLAPFIRYDKLNYKEVKQCLQEFIFNVNVPTRVGFQTPFTNLTLDLTVPRTFAKQPVIIGGMPQKEVYVDFQKEIDLFNKAFLEVMLEGDAKGRVFTFPIPTYNITKDFDWDNPNLELLWEAPAKYGIPYFSNFINSDMKPEDARSMCCRLRLDTKQLERRGGGLFASNPLTGSVGVATINLPRLGYLAKTEKEFLEKLDRLMVLAKQSLEIKRKTLETFTERGLYPYARHYLRKVKENFDCYWKNHFSTIGLIGMNEAALNLLGVNLGEKAGVKFGLKVMNHMRNKLLEFQKETENNYNLEATPAEGASYRLAKADEVRYPDMIFANNTAHQKGAEPFYTNSSQLPINFSDDIFQVLDLQDEMQTKYTGGTVIHIFAGERVKSGQTVKALVQKICRNYHLPYFTFSPTFSVCPTHGYLKGEQERCPTCQARCEVYSRIVGYLRPVQQWNNGKKEEFKNRKSFSVEKSTEPTPSLPSSVPVPA